MGRAVRVGGVKDFAGLLRSQENVAGGWTSLRVGYVNLDAWHVS